MQSSIFERARPLITRSYIENQFSAPGSHWKGDNFWTLNPTRDDSEIGSFSIREDGKWFDHATYTGGDVFDLISIRDGIPAADVARELAGERAPEDPTYSSPSEAERERVAAEEAKKKELLPDWQPIPKDRPPYFKIQPDNLTLFFDNDLVTPKYWVVRYNKSDTIKKKIIYPVYWTGSRYIAKLPPNLKDRTLLPFDPALKVVILEGERKTEMMRAYDKSRLYTYTTWHGGAAQADRIDITPLRGKDVILFPDNDDASMRCFRTIALRIKNIAASVSIITPTPDIRIKYDAADYIEEGRDVMMVIGSAEPFVYKESEVERYEADKTNFTDLGNAERFISIYRGKLHYNVDKNKWLVWTGNVWSDDNQSLITPMVKQTIRSIATDNGSSKEAYAHAMNSESASRIAAMLSLASKELGIAVKEDQLDMVEHIAMAPNGAVNLKTGELEEPDPKHLCSKCMTVEYKKDATAPRFMQFLDEIMGGDKEKIEFLQRWAGYSMTGNTSAQSFLILYGTGANGKSTLVELLARILGGYGKSAPPDTFVVKQAGSIPNDIAALRGARSVLTTETEANARLAESRVKYMTGGDRVSARFMRAEYFEFIPQWKIVISTNHRPRVSGGDFGIWRRVLLLPFKFCADGDSLDQNLPVKLWAEREGVLAWMVAGAVKWYADGMGRPGLAIPKSIMVETQEYRIDEDLIGRYISEECLTGLDLPNTHSEIGSTELFNSFRQWADSQGERFYAQMTQTSFGRSMRERGFESTKIRSGRKGYRGIYPKLGMTITQEMGGRDD